MIFTDIDQNTPVKLSGDDITKLITLGNQLHEKIASFVNDKVASKNLGKTAYAEDIEIEGNKITWTYEKNVACHCHPEYQTFREAFDVNEFYAWLSEQDRNEFWI